MSSLEAGAAAVMTSTYYATTGVDYTGTTTDLTAPAESDSGSSPSEGDDGSDTSATPDGDNPDGTTDVDGTGPDGDGSPDGTTDGTTDGTPDDDGTTEESTDGPTEPDTAFAIGALASLGAATLLF